MSDHLSGIHAKLDSLHESVRDIQVRVCETNGRVKKLEIWQAETAGFIRGVRAAGWLARALWGSVGAVIAAAGSYFISFL